MTHDVVALLDRRPTMRGLTRALVEARRGLRVRTVAEGAVVELRDGAGFLVAAAQAAQRVATSHEVERLLGHGVGERLPAQPWWVEARGAETGPGGTDTAGVVRRFADSLAAEFGGCVWQPGPRLDRSDPLLAGATDHPAVTRTTAHVAIAVQDRPLVPLSPWLADAVATHGRAGRGFQLVTPAETRLTHGLAALLDNPAARWVVRTSAGEYYDGRVGVPLTWHDEAGFVGPSARGPSAAESTEPVRWPSPAEPAEPVPHPHFHRPTGDGGAQDLVDHLLVDLSVLHDPDDDLRLGAEPELLTRTFAGTAPALWGAAEPVAMVWNRDDITALARRRAPNDSRFLFIGPPGAEHTFSGTLSVSRVEEGVKESVTLAVAYPPGDAPELRAVTGLFGKLAARDVKTVSVQRRRGLGDLTRAPHATGPVIPVGIGMGAEAVRTVGLAHAESAPVEPVRFGPRFAPSLWYPIGDGTVRADRERLHALVRHLRPVEAAAGYVRAN